MEFDTIGQIADFTQQLTVVFIEIIHWDDPRLQYTKYAIPELTPYHKTHWIDFLTSKNEIWLPKIDYARNVDMSIQSEQIYVYNNGAYVPLASLNPL
jgi:hypothetical protein